MVLSVDDKAVARVHIDDPVPQRCGTKTMDVERAPVGADYEDGGLFPYSGTIESVTWQRPLSALDLIGRCHCSYGATPPETGQIGQERD